MAKGKNPFPPKGKGGDKDDKMPVMKGKGKKGC